MGSQTPCTMLSVALRGAHSRARVRMGRCYSTGEKPLFDKILVANRGEIACRVFKTARQMGMKTVAVYSEPDEQAVHVRNADEAVCVGPANSSESYLLGDRIIEACKQTGAQAVHPGYGFLSENAEFSEKCEAEGIEFVGPNAPAIRSMGDKIESMRLAQAAGVSTAPRFDGEVHDVEHAVQIATNEAGGYPIIMKASAGGGGKGMRVAWNEEELREGFKLARDEAMSSFGDNRMLIQHFVCPVDGRHIEIQLVGDKHGNVLTLPERECSIQRRNQKVVEEAPSLLLTPETRAKMQSQAAQLAKAAGYHSAGTVEFLADNNQNFYFLEMNTRLQVEHPVTELITGVDLVELMFQVSAGLPIPDELLNKDWSQPKNFNGWAVESRVYAEDPTRDFLPSVGLLTRYVEPTTPGVRCDSGVADGSEISMYYDPMICKLCTHGDTREEAIDRMVEALDSYVIEGLKHNVPLLYDIVDSKEFRTGELTTNFIKNKYGEDGFQSTLSDTASNNLAALVAVVHSAALKQKVGFTESAGRQHKFAAADGFAVSVEMTGSAGAVKHDVVVEGAEGQLQVSIDGGDAIAVDSSYSAADSIVRANLNSETQIAQFVEETLTGYTIQYQGSVFDVNVLTEEQQQAMEWMPIIPELDLSMLIVAPISGTVRAISVEIGDEVGPGQEVVVLEAMKMHNVLRANSAGIVKAIHFATGDVVSAEEFIVELE